MVGSCWLHLLTASLLIRGNGQADEPRFLTATFKPGKLGVGADWNTGRVTRIDKGGQGELNNIEVGMVIKKIDGKTYHESLLDKRIAGKEDFQMTLVKYPAPVPTPAPPRKVDADVPPRPEFKYATELDPVTFKEQVLMVANGTDVGKKKAPYHPFVMFHMSWCKHCKHAMPEFEKAAEMVEKRSTLPVYPKFFLVECDHTPEHQALCDVYTTSSYPLIRLFRDHRAVVFNSPRIAQNFAMFATQVSRPPIMEISDEISMLKSPQSYIFVLHANLNDAALQHWTDVALDNIAEHTLAFVRPGSKASTLLQAAPSVNVFGKGLEPLPFEGDFTRDALSQWVSFNQFAPVAQLTIYSESAFRKTGYVVITLLYHTDDKSSFSQFEFKAKQLRKSGRFLFAAVDTADPDNLAMIDYKFPLLSSSAAAKTPLVFAFSGKETYWESPSMNDLSTLSMESIDALLTDPEALQDGSMLCWIKGKRKMVERFVTGSKEGKMFAVAVPIAVFALFKHFIVPCCRAVFADDDDSTKQD